MRSATEWFDLYGESHKNPVNKAIHWVCIPVIVLSTLGLFQAIPHPFGDVPGLHWGTVAAALALVFYASISWTIFAGMALVAASCLAINAGIERAGLPILWVSVGIFAVAWVFQFVGHKIEGKKPSFFEDVQYLWVGPLFVLSRLFPRLGIRW